MAGLDAQLARLKLDQRLVDVTDDFRNLARGMEPESIIKAPSFDLFEGTHSLEIDNIKLDSSLLILSEQELSFDCGKTYGAAEEDKLEFVTAVADRLCRSIVLWLNEFQTLPTTLLSCRYMEHILSQYTEDPVSDLSTCHLETGHELFDQVLTSCVFGACYFVKFVQTLFKAGVVFEEEDLNCNAMGLNMLAMVKLQTVKSHLQNSKHFLQAKYPAASQLLLIVELFTNLIELHEYLPSNPELNAAPNTQALIELVNCAQKLKQIEMPPRSILQGAFSPGIQKRLSNQFPPREIVEPSGNEYDGFITIAKDLQLVLSVDQAKTVSEIAQLSRFFNRIEQRHVVARALYLLYLMRDDQTVLDQYTFNDFSFLHLQEFSLCDTALSNELECESGNPTVREKFDDFLVEISSVLFEWYQTTAQNPCRYRQGYNRQLLLWDSLQAQIETYELELEGQGIRDELDADNSFMPLTTWVFYMKLRAMSDFVLKGFKLDVYKPWEFFSMFWYSYYLAQHLENNLARVSRFISDRITAITNLNKKLKKLKAGEKKDKLRDLYRSRMATQMPLLVRNRDFISYLTLDCTVIKTLSLAQVFQFAMLKSFGLIDNKHPGSGKFSSPEFTHKLRFKTFESIGVPELPSYELFQQSLEDFVITEPMFGSKLMRSFDFTENELEKVKESLQSIFETLKDNESQARATAGTQLVQEESLAYYQGLYRSTEALISNGRELRAKLGNKASRTLIEKYKVSVSRPQGGCPYFPLLSLSEQ
ncbi:LANO_0D03466g1_1 [Lachancea nothofagi CBS 11611]|uniref:LANO_0D03466g1_1 n=1 Tax=Lachancea nothofagi CBS 11611 TaxID=1266666 RepID=A0A1G4JF93_9SACH|nr:LANO_0D03466g1_1 [Lachancea nothofagi CBS 11611]